MRLALAVALCLFSAAPAWAAMTATTVWEVRGATGSDTNGGGYDASVAGGTDFSQQASAQFSGTDGASASASTTFTSAGSTFTTAIPGNVMQITTFTGTCTSGFYRVTARSSNTSITLDRSPCSATGSLITFKVGGALQTIQAGLNAVTVADQLLYVKADGTYTITTALSPPSITPTQYRNRMIGYNTTRSDQGLVTVNQTGAANGISASQQAWQFENFILDGTNTGLIGVNVTASYIGLVNMRIKNFKNEGVVLVGTSITLVYLVEVSNCVTTSGTAAISIGAGASGPIVSLYIHDNPAPGIVHIGSNSIVNSVIANNTGAASDGIRLGGINHSLIGNTVYGNGRDGIRATAANDFAASAIVNNILANNGGWGQLSSTVQTSPGIATSNNNAYWKNTSGTVSGISLSATDVDLGSASTADPFTFATKFTDLVIDGTTNTKITSAAFPFNTTHVGQTLTITGGTGFTVQTVTVVSVTGVTATMSASMGTLSSTGGTGHGNDFSLNRLNPGGAQIAKVGFPVLLPGLLPTNYPDIGAYQRQELGTGWFH